jgi:hypothetical protein
VATVILPVQKNYIPNIPLFAINEKHPPKKVDAGPGSRNVLVYKAFMNSFWFKYGQRKGLTNPKVQA